MTGLLEGKRGLVMGVANERSIAWGIARAMADAGAELAFAIQSDAHARRVIPLAASLGSDFLIQTDVADEASLDACFDRLRQQWGQIDFVVHAIAHAHKTDLQGRIIAIPRDNFVKTMTISCYSFIDVARRAADLMPDGGTLITLTYQGSTRVVPNYNVMGLAKAALESATRYLADDLGPLGIRVNAISPGPVKTVSGTAVGDSHAIWRHSADNAPLRGNPTLEAIGGTAVWLASPGGACTTGQIIHVDGGFSVRAMPLPEHL